MRRVFVLVWIYGGLGAIAALYALYKGAFDPAHSEFAGMPLLILALPWSWVLRDFAPRIVSSQYNNSVVIESMFVVLNTALLALFFSAARSIVSRKG